MGNKVDIKEVQEMSDKFNQKANTLEEDLAMLQQKLDEVRNLESFQGRTAENLKSYIEEVHGTIILLFASAINDLREGIVKSIDTFRESVDSDDGAKIAEDYLIELEEGYLADYEDLEEPHSQLQKIVEGISDISNVANPNLSTVTENKDEIKAMLESVRNKLGNFAEASNDKQESAKEILEEIKKICKGSKAYNQGTNNKNNDNVILYTSGQVYENSESGIDWKKVESTIDGYTNYAGTGGDVASFILENRAMALVAKNRGLQVIDEVINGQTRSKVIASPDALKKLGIDFNSNKVGKQTRNHGGAILYDSKKGNYTQLGKKIVDKYPTLGPMNGSWKAVGTAVKEGLKEGIKDPFTGWSNGVFKWSNAGKALGAVGLGLSIFDNTKDALEDGFQGTDAPRIVVDTAIDFGTSTALVTGGAAIGTALLPVVGTVIGGGIGFLADLWLNSDRKGKGSFLQKGKDKLHEWFGW